jgi:glucose-1-phosphate adenylyltransferase
VPISNCINSSVTQIFVLTQYNSASLNRHISRTYRFSSFSTGFVEVLAAEQRKDSPIGFRARRTRFARRFRISATGGRIRF